MDNKLYIVMVGLPARGKSTTATKITEDLRHESIKVRIFNNGDLRRKMTPINTSIAEFYDPHNREGVAIREKIAEINLTKAKRYLKEGGDVAIIDATNASVKRRNKVKAMLDDHPLLFIECINNDEEILNASILRKIETPEFSHLPAAEAILNFKKRISYYTPIYTPLKNETNFVRINSLYKTVLREEIKNTVPYYDMIRDFLVTDTIKHLYLIRHGETFYNLENRIGGDSELTEKGLSQAEGLAEYFSNKELPLIFTSEKRRTIQTAEPIKAMQKKCTIIPLAEFNEINSGICESMSYKEIREKYPYIYSERKTDKYHYAYPKGEGYASMKERIDRGINKVMYLSNSSGNIMIIGHRATNRMILSHFLFRREEDVPYIYIPQDKFYYISVTQNRKFFQLKKFK